MRRGAQASLFCAGWLSSRCALAVLDLPHQMDAIHLDKHSKRMQTRPLNTPYTSKKNNLYHEKHSGDARRGQKAPFAIIL